MLNANYTSENIARALGLGGFANDETMGPAPQALRVLLTPSFHPEVCLTFLRAADRVNLSVVAARAQIWLQSSPAPSVVLTHQAQANCDLAAFDQMFALLHAAEDAGDLRGLAIVDGMRAHSVLRREGHGLVNLDEHASTRPSYTHFITQAISHAWSAIDSPRVKNTLRDAGHYVDLDLELQNLPPEKPTVQTMVLGPEDTRSALIEALKRKHRG